MSYDGYKLKNGRWQFVDNLDRKNNASPDDEKFIAPEAAPKIELTRKPVKGK